jgi:hypothetical protein
MYTRAPELRTLGLLDGSHLGMLMKPMLHIPLYLTDWCVPSSRTGRYQAHQQTAAGEHPAALLKLEHSYSNNDAVAPFRSALLDCSEHCLDMPSSGRTLPSRRLR